MKKQLLPFLTILLSAAAATAADGDVFTIDELKYTVTSETDCHVSVEAVDKATISGDVIIPSSVTNNGITYSVTEIPAWGFSKGMSGTFFKSIEIPNSVTKIGDSAFQQSFGLTSITIPNSVTYLGSSAFANCLNLNSVSISSSLTQLNEFTFSMCYALREIVDYNPEPQSLERSVFNSVPASAVVYVPKGCVEAYSIAEG